jgi:lipopolysaccharide/colanic/teichoic acid biosynthesis glycosyltransferase
MKAIYRFYGPSPLRMAALRRRYAFWSGWFGWIFSTAGYRGLKRALDIAASGAALLLLSPLFALLALAIKVTDRGPVLFWQKRVGRHGEEFDFPKFRSMVVNAEQIRQKLLAQNQHQVGVTFKMRNDPRRTAIGTFMRRFSLDELPQLWCVLRGDMTLVGPRPPLPSEVREYSLEAWRRLEVTPGLTCIWQVSGRSDLDFIRQVELDIEYIETQSLWRDVELIARTVPAVVSGKGAY